MATFEGPAKVELLGHRVEVGFIAEVEVLGTKMLQITIPEIDGKPSRVDLYGAGAIYGIHACTEEDVIAYHTPYVPRQLRSPTVTEEEIPFGTEGGTATPVGPEWDAFARRAYDDQDGEFDDVRSWR